MVLMEVEMNKYVIQFENGRKVIVSADSLEEAIDRFKELFIDTERREIRVMSAYEMYNKRKKQ
jgi:uncharacterized protein YlzI (FlbEa/FlbD family)